MKPSTIAAHFAVALFRASRRTVRRVIRPARLWWVAQQERNAEDHIADLSAMHVATLQNMLRMHRVTVELAAKRQAIERGLA